MMEHDHPSSARGAVTPTVPERDPRVALAAERTLLAWVRTGLAMMGFGFVVARFALFLREIAAVQEAPVAAPQHHVSLWVGTGMVVLGVVVNAVAGLQHIRFMRRFNRGEPVGEEAGPMGVVLALVLAALGVALAFYLVGVA